MENFLSAKDAAKKLTISYELLRQLVKKEQIPCHWIGARMIFFESELVNWLKTQTRRLPHVDPRTANMRVIVRKRAAI